MRRRWGAVVLGGCLAMGVVAPPALASGGIIPGRAPWPVGGTMTVGRGGDVEGSNSQLAESLPATLTLKWSAAPALCIGSSGSAAISISVVGATVYALDAQSGGCEFLSAYDVTTGALHWRRPYMLAQNATYRDGTLFVRYSSQDRAATLLDAVDPATGAVRWTSGLTNDNLITAGSGIVMTDLWALDERTGALRWTADPGPTATTWGRPFIAGGQAFQNNATTVAAFDPATGRRLWLVTKSGAPTDPGSGNALPALHDNLLYVRSAPGPKAPVLVLDAATGKQIRALPRSDGAMVFDGTTAFLTQRSYGQTDVLRAVNTTTGATYWTRPVPHPRNQVRYVGPTPIVSNGLIWLVTVIDTVTPSTLYALDERTGKVVSKTALPCPSVYDYEGPSLGDNVNMALAQHHLFVPTTCRLLTYAAN